MKKDIRLLLARKMPKLYHKLPGQDFDIQKSEVVNWLIHQPEILKFIFDKVAKEEIIFNSDTGKWQGADHEKPKCYTPNDDPYPLCKGEDTPQGFAENSCFDCCLYEDYEEGKDYV